MEKKDPWSEQAQNKTQRVVVTDIDIPFGSMVTFLVKGAIAVIPAAIILAILGAFLTFVFPAIFGFGS